MEREEQKKVFIASLFTQLVVNGLSVDAAITRAHEAADKLGDLPYPEIKVG